VQHTDEFLVRLVFNVPRLFPEGARVRKDGHAGRKRRHNVCAVVRHDLVDVLRLLSVLVLISAMHATDCSERLATSLVSPSLLLSFSSSASPSLSHTHRHKTQGRMR
jgi:hypothetical protein